MPSHTRTRRDAAEEMTDMPRGGARSHSGPPPDPNSGRSEKRDWTNLPVAGRQKPAPDWPLVEPSPRELELWEAWWAEPVAVIWEDAHTLHYVAFTVRMFAEAEQPKARTEDRKSLNQMMANLYLTPDSQLRAGIKIVAKPERAPVVPVEDDDDPRGRLTVVQGGA